MIDEYQGNQIICIFLEMDQGDPYFIFNMMEKREKCWYCFYCSYTQNTSETVFFFLREKKQACLSTLPQCKIDPSDSYFHAQHPKYIQQNNFSLYQQA